MKLDQVLLIDKPPGITSFGVVARIRRKMTEVARSEGWQGKRFRVGHTGTLDPFATGLMIVLTGRATKNAAQYSKLDKVYEATIRLGATSTTGDIEGTISPVPNRKCPPVDKSEITAVLKSFVGEITQTPPIYSAIKVNGERAYKLARKGKDVKIPERKVTIYDIKLISYSFPTLTIRANVSSGTYIRTLAEDIGKRLGTGAYTEKLRRISVGKHNIADATPLEDFMVA